MTMSIEESVSNWRRLLALEHAAGRARFEEEAKLLDVPGLVSAGLAMSGLVVQETGAGALGRAAWILAPRQGELPGVVGPGEPVAVFRRRSPEETVRGLVSRRTLRSLTIVFDEPPDPDWESAELVVQRLYDDRSHNRIVTGLSMATGSSRAAARWRELVFGGARLDPWSWQPLEDDALNEAQRQAAGRALAAPLLSLVHGPPGTGKTQVLAAIARAELQRGGTVLACAASNAAVDNLVLRLAAVGLDPVRVGHPARVHPEVVDRTLEARTEAHEKAVIAADLVRQAHQLLRRADRAARQGRAADRGAEARAARQEARQLFADARRLGHEAEDEVLSKAKILCATLTGLDRLGDRTFTLSVIDEATQATLPASWLALVRAERAVLAGDQHQLPPTILSPEAARQGLARTLYEQVLESHGESIATMLEVQHRMNRAIMAYPSQALYGGRLTPHPSVADHTLADRPPLQLVDSAGKGWSEERPPESESLENPGEAERVASEVRALLTAGVEPSDIGVVVPYAAQVRLLRTLLPDDALEIDTVDAFQGREKEAILVSMVRSNDTGELGFCADVRRVNVALTRARRRLFVVGDSATLAAHPFLEGFIRHTQESGGYTSAWEETE